jgi:TRAP transporter TAXI family solute receptor
MAILGSIFCTVFAVLTVGCEQKAERAEHRTQVIFGTGLTADDEMYALSRSVMRSVEKYKPQFEIVLGENPGGTTEVIKNIDRYHFCGISLDEAAQAHYGFYAWQGKGQPQLRLLSVMGILPVAFLAAVDTGIDSVSDLEGKPYGNGCREDRGGFKTAKLLEALNIRPQWNRDSLNVQVELYKRGALAGFIICGAGRAFLLECGESRPFRLFGISEPEFSKAGSRYRGSGLTYPRAIIRAGSLPAQDKEIVTFGLLTGYFSRKDLPAEIASGVLKAVWEDVWEVSASYQPLKQDIIGFPKLTFDYGPLPLHQGAVTFYRDMKLRVPERLLPPEMR